MNDFDKYLQDTIKQDQLNFEPAPSILLRLRNHIKIISIRSTPSLNSVFSLKLSDFRPLSGLKVGFACLLLVALFSYRQISSFSGVLLDKDTTQISTPIDTNVFQVSDTISMLW